MKLWLLPLIFALDDKGTGWETESFLPEMGLGPAGFPSLIQAILRQHYKTLMRKPQPPEFPDFGYDYNRN